METIIAFQVVQSWQELLRDRPFEPGDRIPFQRSLNRCVIGFAES